MDLLTSAVWVLLRWAARLLPEPRRAWVEAVRSEAAELPAGRARLSWLLGGLWLVARQAVLARRIGCSVAGAAAGALIVWLDWHPGSANPAVPTNRLTTIAVVALLAGLPWMLRPMFGPAADNRAARTVRVGGYLGLYALLGVVAWLSRFAGSRFDHMHAFDQKNWEADMRSGAVVSAALLIGIVGSYAVAILVLTSRRVSVPAPVLGFGAAGGAMAALLGYALMPLGNPLHPANGLLALGYDMALALPLGAAPVAAFLAARRGPAGEAHSPARTRLRRGGVAGLCVGGVAALLLNVFTIGTMLLLPDRVELRWANPDPNVAHGTPYEIQMSVGDAAIKYEAALLLAPLIGLALGAIGAQEARKSNRMGFRRAGSSRLGRWPAQSRVT